jgi:peptidoglycan hydrolase-like protein with peptidoglycan-binding domain
MSTKRIATMCGILLLMAVMAGGAWFAGERIVSPAEAAARTAPPSPSPILVPIEKRVLSSEIITRGTARFGTPQPIALAPSALKTNASGLLTTLPLPNTQFKEGDMLFTASGRPVMALQGRTPAYRDLVPGAMGADVLQLEQALKRLGFDPGDLDGKYDEKTSAAVSAWYKAKGYEPFGPTPEQQARVRVLETALGDAIKSRLAADTAAASAELAVKNAQTKARLAERTAKAEISTRIADQALLALDPKSLQMARIAADAKVDIARSAVDSAKLDGQATVRAALDAQKVIQFDLKLTTEREAQAKLDWQNVVRRLGVSVPLDEIVFIPSMPVRVEQVMGIVGGNASGPILSVTDNQLIIDSSLPLVSAPLVKPGMEVAIDEPSLGFKAKGVVETIAPTPGTRGVDGYHFYFAVRVGETSIPLQGFSLRLTMPTKSTGGAVTAVPMSALSLAADGTSRIQVQKNGAIDYVTVEPGMVADGYVQVKPVKGSLEPGQLVVVGNAQTAADDSASKQP